MPSRLRRGAGRDGKTTAVLLAQMGLHESHQGNGHGRTLFLRAAREAAVCAAVCRVPLLVVDAADEDLVPFYASFGMRLIPNSFRLVASLSKVPTDTG